jgi:hypothetical protein
VQRTVLCSERGCPEGWVLPVTFCPMLPISWNAKGLQPLETAAACGPAAL